jgi:hypothetical protein
MICYSIIGITDFASEIKKYNNGKIIIGLVLLFFLSNMSIVMDELARYLKLILIRNGKKVERKW